MLESFGNLLENKAGIREKLLNDAFQAGVADAATERSISLSLAADLKVGEVLRDSGVAVSGSDPDLLKFQEEVIQAILRGRMAVKY